MQDLLQTASSTGLSLKHGATALNALCGFLEQCSTSSEYRTKALPYNVETWTRAFNIFVTKSDNNKPKPLRWLLLTLGGLIASHPVDADKDLLLGTAICTASRAIRKKLDTADVKPAIQVLEHFLTKDLISAAEIAQIKKPEELRNSRNASVNEDNQSHDTKQGQVNQSIQEFAISALEWVQYPDCAPTVGRFLPRFFNSLEESQSDSAVHLSKEAVRPLWISPVKQYLERHQGLLEVFGIHVLPGLLRLGPTHANAFLNLLPYQNIQRGNIGSSSIPDIQLCLLVAKTAEDPGLRNYFNQRHSSLLDTEDLGISLLEHSSSDVRIAALSLLVSSSASARPFRRRVLRRVRECIPHFHVEVNPKPRNEFIALIKKLCIRLRGATISLLECDQDPGTFNGEQTATSASPVASVDCEQPVRLMNTIEQAVDDVSRVLEEHLAFRKWYMVFLLRELHPTASYQSHITALKVLECLMGQDCACRNTSIKGQQDYIDSSNEDLPRGFFLRPLTELLLDPFDDVRQFADTALSIYLTTSSRPRISQSTGGVETKVGLVDQEAKNQADNEVDDLSVNQSILSALNKAETIAGLTGRADHADGFGRLINVLYETAGTLAKPARWQQSCYSIVDHLLSTIEKEVDLAKEDLLIAVSSKPLHGRLIALRYDVFVPTEPLQKLKEYIQVHS